MHPLPTSNESVASPIRAAANPQRRWFAGLAALGVLSGLASLPGTVAAQVPGGGGGPGRSPEDMAKHLQARIAYVVTLLDGTPEQTAKLTALAKTATAELAPLRAQMRKARQDGMALLAEPTINRAAVEQLRSGQIQLADSLSKRASQLMVEAAEVLTPPQRVKLAEMAQRRMEKRGRHHGGGGWGGFGR
ncbi:MAG: Spy/CpxP family protein refolding chaperone [Burkholderiaceae bacterium]